MQQPQPQQHELLHSSFSSISPPLFQSACLNNPCVSFVWWIDLGRLRLSVRGFFCIAFPNPNIIVAIEICSRMKVPALLPGQQTGVSWCSNGKTADCGFYVELKFSWVKFLRKINDWTQLHLLCQTRLKVLGLKRLFSHKVAIFAKTSSSAFCCARRLVFGLL